MTGTAAQAHAFNIVIVAQAGRLQYEALVFAASLAAHAPALSSRLFVAEPLPGPRWPGDPRIGNPAIREALQGMGARFIGFESRYFGASYPHGNKIEALAALPEGEPFVFFDTDTLVTGPLDRVAFDFARPSASVQVEPTWPEPQPYIAGYDSIWRALYQRFGLDIAPTLDLSQPEDYWKRYMYFNAGWFYGACPVAFGKRFADYAVAIRNAPGDILAAQSLDPWLDQVALPLVIASFGGGRPGPELDGLDGDVTCHYRALPLLYARNRDQVVEVLEEVTADKALKRLLREWEPAKKLIYQGKGRQKVRPLFDRADLPVREQVIRNTIKREGWWLR